MPRNNAKPRYATQPTSGSRLAQKPILSAAERLGTPAMPWQKRVIRLIGELRDPTPEELAQFGPVVEGGLPRYRQVIASVPRQAGKSALAKAAMVAKAEERPDLDLYTTAQTRIHATDHLADLSESLGDLHYTRAAGREMLTWTNGSTMRPIAPNRKGGHGASIDGMLIDEGWALTDDVLQGVIPAMSARPLAQLIIISTMGTQEDTTWNNLVTLGRESVSDPNSTIAYVEYSSGNDADVFDPTKWGQWMPSLGLTISRASIESDMRIIEAGPEGRAGVVRAYGNRVTAAKVSIFGADLVTAAWRVIEPPQRFVLAVDVNDSPAGAAVATGHLTDDGIASRLVQAQSGTPRWVPGLVAEMIQKRQVEAVVADFGGPAKQIEAELEKVCGDAYVPLVSRKPREVAADTQRFYDGLREGTLVMTKTAELDEAISGAVRKTLGDVWLVSRTLMAVDASPLIATILSVGLASELAVSPVVNDVVMAW